MKIAKYKHGVSVMIPTRKRVDKLIRCLESIEQTIDNPNSIEVLLAIDNDDTETQEKLAPWIEEKHIRYELRPMLFDRPEAGYGGLHIYYQGMFEASNGIFMFFVNDDSILGTKGWDAEMCNHINNITSVLWPTFTCPDFHGGGNPFPAIHRHIIELAETIGDHAHLDLWYEFIHRLEPIMVPLPNVRIDHIRDVLPTTPGYHEKPFAQEHWQRVNIIAGRVRDDRKKEPYIKYEIEQ